MTNHVVFEIGRTRKVITVSPRGIDPLGSESEMDLSVLGTDVIEKPAENAGGRSGLGYFPVARGVPEGLEHNLTR